MGPTVRKKTENNVFALSSAIIWFDFHLSKAQGVVETSPIIPLHPVTVGRVIASQIEAVQVHGDKYGVPLYCTAQEAVVTGSLSWSRVVNLRPR